MDVITILLDNVHGQRRIQIVNKPNVQIWQQFKNVWLLKIDAIGMVINAKILNHAQISFLRIV